METRPLIKTKSAPRTIYAAGLLTALLAALLGAWFFTGWHDVRMRQHEASQTPRIAAERRANDLARELHGELEALIAREVRRPYFHYQNLIHDPQASPGLNVSPSPLARGAEDTLVLGYFQLDAKGRATTPTINDDVPRLSEPEHLAENRAFRDHVVRDLSRDLAPAATATGPRVAEARAAPRSRSPRPQPELESSPFPQQQQALVLKVDPNVYAQNINPNAVYSQQSQVAQNNRPQAAPVASSQVPVTTPAPVTVTISPLEWRTLPFAGEPALLAIRQVQTPDGTLAQGFVVDSATLKSWLATKAGDMVAELHPDDSRGAAIAPGWSLTVEPNPRTLAQVADDANAIARAFLLRFFAIGSIAMLAAAF